MFLFIFYARPHNKSLATYYISFQNYLEGNQPAENTIMEARIRTGAEEITELQNKSSEEDSTSGDGRLWNLSPKQVVFHSSRADVHASRDSICSLSSSKYVQGKGRSSHSSANRDSTLLEDPNEEDRHVPQVPKRMKIIDSFVTYFVFFCSVSKNYYIFLYLNCLASLYG